MNSQRLNRMFSSFACVTSCEAAMTWSRPEGQRASAGPNLIRRRMMMMMMVMIMMKITMVVETGMMQSWLAEIKWLSANHGNVVTSSETNQPQMRYMSGHLISEMIAALIRIMMSRAMIIAMLT